MTRISEYTTINKVLYLIGQQKQRVATLSEQLSSGISVDDPGESTNSGTISQLQQLLERAKGYKDRIANVTSIFSLQDRVLGSASDLIIRASEIATQAANETNSVETRAQLAEEVFQIRDNLVELANTTYQGKYIYSGLDDSTPAYSASTYTNPASGEASERYVYNTNAGTLLTKTVKISDDMSVTLNTPGNKVFDDAIQALERLGRALKGYKTEPATGAPNGSGDPYDFNTEFSLQTADIQNCLNLLKSAREEDLMPERVDVAGRLRRLETATSLIDLATVSSQEVLDRLQSTDMIDVASQYTAAQTALDAALTINVQLLSQSILNYL